MTTHDLTFHHPRRDRRGAVGRVRVGGVWWPGSALPAALVAGMLAAVVVPPLAAPIAVLAPAIIAAAHDVRGRRVPDRWVVATAVGGGAASIAAGPAGPVAAVVGAAALGLPHLVVHAAAPDWLGFGDVKLAAALGFVVGPAGATLHERLMVATMVASGAAAVGLVGAAVVRRREVAYAPALVLATVAVLIAQQFGLMLA